MRIDVVNNAEGFSEDKLNGLDEYIISLSEAILSGDYTSPKVTRSLKDAYATLTFVTPEEIKEVNREQREIDKETDCLSFPMLELTEGEFDMIPDSGDFETDEDGNQILCYGDILINPVACEAQADSYGHSFEREAMFLIAHSLLHLLGYDHVEDEEAEKMYRKLLQMTRGYVQDTLDETDISIADSLCRYYENFGAQDKKIKSLLFLADADFNK